MTTNTDLGSHRRSGSGRWGGLPHYAHRQGFAEAVAKGDFERAESSADTSFSLRDATSVVVPAAAVILLLLMLATVTAASIGSWTAL